MIKTEHCSDEYLKIQWLSPAPATLKFLATQRLIDASSLSKMCSKPAEEFLSVALGTQTDLELTNAKRIMMQWQKRFVFFMYIPKEKITSLSSAQQSPKSFWKQTSYWIFFLTHVPRYLNVCFRILMCQLCQIQLAWCMVRQRAVWNVQNKGSRAAVWTEPDMRVFDQVSSLTALSILHIWIFEYGAWGIQKDFLTCVRY